jgi:hypothetical protein
MALHKDWLYIHILNVGDGDAIILELPRYGDETIRRFGIVDCGQSDKAFRYLLYFPRSWGEILTQ